MKNQNLLNVLMYLFKNHMQSGCEFSVQESALIAELEDVGFRRRAIAGAFGWLENLMKQNHVLDGPQASGTFRVFSDYECKRLDMECRSFLTFLEQGDILTPKTREIVIIQALELEAEEINIGLIKWVTLMVLFSQSGEHQALASMELLVLDDMMGQVH